MNHMKTRSRIANRTILATAGVLLLLLSAFILMLHGNATSNQAIPALIAQVYFDGEYRIADGQWHKIVKGEHISANDGEVILRGKFMMSFPDGEVVGPLMDGGHVALFFDHLGGSIWINGTETHVFAIILKADKKSV